MNKIDILLWAVTAGTIPTCNLFVKYARKFDLNLWAIEFFILFKIKLLETWLIKDKSKV